MSENPNLVFLVFKLMEEDLLEIFDIVAAHVKQLIPVIGSSKTFSFDIKIGLA